MISEEALIKFAEPHYANKDIMHDMWHIKLVQKMVNRILSVGRYNVDRECLLLATYFHGFIYKNEADIKQWLTAQQYSNEMISKIIKISWESQRSEIPETLEGKILHDAHVLEGGKAYLIVKTLVTGSVRRQSLIDTLKYMEQNVLDKNKCYLPETIPLCEEMNKYTDRFFRDLMDGIL